MGFFLKLRGKRRIKLQTKLFVSFILISELFLILFSLFMYMYISPMLIENKIDSVRTLNLTFKEQVDSSIKDLDSTSSNINYSNIVIDDFKEYFQEEDSRNKLQKLGNIFVAINGTDIKADQINLYDLDGNVIKVGMVNGKTKKDVKLESWYSETSRLSGFKNIGEPYYTVDYSVGAVSPDWYISLYRTLSDNYGRKIGFVETVKKCSFVFKPIINYEKKENSSLKTFVYNDKGQMVYPYANEYSDYMNYYEIVENPHYLLTMDNCYVVNPNNGQKEHLIYNKSYYSNWTYISVQPEGFILEPANNLLMFLIPLTTILALVSIVASYLLSKNMVTPINDLKEMIRNLEIDTLGENQFNKYKTYYELDQVYEDFQNMSKKINVSMNELITSRQQELEAKSLALQAQINPHFYYNTLSNIIVLSEDEQNDQVIKLCKNLSQIMRYITDNTSTIVSIEEEIAYVEKYLYCMKVRYQDSLKILIDIPEEMNSIKIPKLIIQPLVENAVKYGTDCIPPWTINIKGIFNDDGWQIHIVDSGNGFSDEILRQFDEKVKKVSVSSQLPELKIDGMGIINVYIRWKIYAKENYLLELKNTEEGHGEVIIGMRGNKNNK